jgi:hypothetical protein
LAIAREHGALFLEWGVSSHWLLMRASSFDERQRYDIVGSRVEPHAPVTPQDQYAEYTHKILFPGNDFYQSPPISEVFSVTIVPGSESPEQFTDQLTFQYDTVQCTCTYRDF